MQYYPGQSQPDWTWVQNELRKIAEAMEKGSNTLRLQPTTTAPGKAVDGEIRVADGTNWNPGRGAGTYIFRNNEWQLLEAGYSKDIRSMEFFLGE